MRVGSGVNSEGSLFSENFALKLEMRNVAQPSAAGECQGVCLLLAPLA